MVGTGQALNPRGRAPGAQVFLGEQGLSLRLRNTPRLEGAAASKVGIQENQDPKPRDQISRGRERSAAPAPEG